MKIELASGAAANVVADQFNALQQRFISIESHLRRGSVTDAHEVLDKSLIQAAVANLETMFEEFNNGR